MNSIDQLFLMSAAIDRFDDWLPDGRAQLDLKCNRVLIFAADEDEINRLLSIQLTLRDRARLMVGCDRVCLLLNGVEICHLDRA